MVLYPLMPLKIPSGWKVISNTFYDIDATEEYRERRLFSENMLIIERDIPSERKDKYIIDLGWLPSHSPGGRYRITVVAGDFEHVLKQFEHKDRGEIQSKIDLYLQILSSFLSLEEVPAALSAV